MLLLEQIDDSSRYALPPFKFSLLRLLSLYIYIFIFFRSTESRGLGLVEFWWRGLAVGGLVITICWDFGYGYGFGFDEDWVRFWVYGRGTATNGYEGVCSGCGIRVSTVFFH